MRQGHSDQLGRPLRDLRISITDRCNFRCVYCMPKEVFGRDHQFMRREELLTFEEITRVSRIFVDCGVEKIRITGGEPLLRRDVEGLISRLALLGIPDLALTTNGARLGEKAAALKKAGLKRVTVSLDSLDHDTFTRLNDVDFPVQVVLSGIEAALSAGLNPLKVNMVVKRGVNEASILPMAAHFRELGCTLRFIEYMDVGHSNGWHMAEVVPGAEILSILQEQFPLEPVPPRYPGEVATRYRYQDGKGEIGLIRSVTAAFCGSCTRARLSAEGVLYTCLFATSGTPLRAMLRSGITDDQLRDRIDLVWKQRADQYSAKRSQETIGLPKVEMSYIGG